MTLVALSGSCSCFFPVRPWSGAGSIALRRLALPAYGVPPGIRDRAVSASSTDRLVVPRWPQPPVSVAVMTSSMAACFPPLVAWTYGLPPRPPRPSSGRLGRDRVPRLHLLPFLAPGILRSRTCRSSRSPVTAVYGVSSRSPRVALPWPTWPRADRVGGAAPWASFMVASSSCSAFGSSTGRSRSRASCGWASSRPTSRRTRSGTPRAPKRTCASTWT
jgi:hypothetical protein